MGNGGIQNGDGWLVPCVLAFVSFCLLSLFAAPPVSFILLLPVLALIFGIPFYLNHKASETLGEKLRDAVQRHMAVLVRRRTQLLTKDAYGTPETAKWSKEIDHFLNTQLVPYLTERELRQARRMLDEAREAIEILVRNEATHNAEAFFLPIDKMNGTDFELHCAQRLRKAGWDAQVTKGSGDQGVDVLAELEGSKLALQCKLYSQPVGNKAVQEAVAGRTHYGAQFSGVVSNAAFTPSAKQLAASNGVLLLHFSELDDLADRLGIGTT